MFWWACEAWVIFKNSSIQDVNNKFHKNYLIKHETTENQTSVASVDMTLTNTLDVLSNFSEACVMTSNKLVDEISEKACGL